jgi:hypothetical protein
MASTWLNVMSTREALVPRTGRPMALKKAKMVTGAAGVTKIIEKDAAVAAEEVEGSVSSEALSTW